MSKKDLKVGLKKSSEESFKLISITSILGLNTVSESVLIYSSH